MAVAESVHEGVAGGHGGHHETARERDGKERLALWLLIGGDVVFFLLEIFTWFYLRALNTNGMWRGTRCSTSKPCTDGLGNAITHEVAKASPSYSIIIALLTVAAALLLVKVERSGIGGASRSSLAVLAGLPVVALLAAVAVQCYQFGNLPFSTIDGAYASTFEFFMGSTLVHLLVTVFVAVGIWNRSRLGRFSDGAPWFRIRLARIFAVWIALSTCLLVVTMSAFS